MPTGIPRSQATTRGAAPEADVILDVLVERGALHFVLACEGGHAHGVRVRFSRVIRDLAGQRVNEQPLYTQLAFLAAGRRIPLLIDSLAGYQQRRQPMQFEARLEWRSEDGRRLRRVINHDLAAWTGVREIL
ncbi:MAG: hypothetical protein HXX12_13000 [Geothrix sp.]|uniref:hypothetical protein n=1 Tax=Geothrix sp. TaxID=1962974 RepID=UPI00185EAD23|nr:hypothetical protein [Geothrix sp.]NWJ41874.1 hypothetical protein [Geothrix sp.]WIL20153.1 MAG: hypothetical protein QOZ81_002699 [Geothrix sp.]